MAIRNESTDTLINTNIGSSQKITDVKRPDSNDSNNEPKVSDEPKKAKKIGFLASVIDELKKVEWPNLSYITKWSVIIVIFTAVFAVSLSGVDHVYESGVKFVNCTSSQGENKFFDGNSVSGTCFQEFAQRVIGQK